MQNNGVDKLDQEFLLDIFEHAMRTTATTLARKVWFDLADFERTRAAHCTEYKMTLEKYTEAGAEQWSAIFEAENKWLKVFGTLERD